MITAPDVCGKPEEEASAILVLPVAPTQMHFLKPKEVIHGVPSSSNHEFRYAADETKPEIMGFSQFGVQYMRCVVQKAG